MPSLPCLPRVASPRVKSTHVLPDLSGTVDVPQTRVVIARSSRDRCLCQCRYRDSFLEHTYMWIPNMRDGMPFQSPHGDRRLVSDIIVLLSMGRVGRFSPLAGIDVPQRHPRSTGTDRYRLVSVPLRGLMCLRLSFYVRLPVSLSSLMPSPFLTHETGFGGRTNPGRQTPRPPTPARRTAGSWSPDCHTRTSVSDHRR